MYMNSVPIEKELERNPALKTTDLEELNKWCLDKHYSPGGSSLSDLAIFLHASYYYVETAKSNIESYYVARHSLPQFFNDRAKYTEELQKIFDTVAIVPLAKRTREGYKVILIRPLDGEQKNIQCIDAIKVFNMVLEMDIHEEGTQEGYVFVVDVHGTNVFDPNSFDAAAVKKYFDYLQKSMPIRWFGLHFVNTVLPFVQSDPFTRMTILKNDYTDAMYFHVDLDSLNEVVPLDALPDEMGGKAGFLKELQIAELEKLRKMSYWFTVLESRDSSCRNFRDIFANLAKFSVSLTSNQGQNISHRLPV